MDIGALAAYDIPVEVINALREHYGDTLFPLQVRCLKDGYLTDEKNRLIVAPTSSGKTLAGEIAALRHALQGRATLYLTPTRALAEEKYHQLSRVYGSLRLKIVLSTRDWREFDECIAKGDFHIAVVVYEKLKGLLARHGGLLGRIGLVIVDELQKVGEVGRGADLEILLTQILDAPKPVQMLCLSAVIGNPEELGSWLRAGVIVDGFRPVELRQGVLLDGVFRYRSRRTGEVGEEEFPAPPGAEPQEIMLATALHLASRDEGCLVFLPLRVWTEQCAAKLAELSSLASADGALGELATFPPSPVRDTLSATLKRGIAFHHAGLSWSYRDLVQRYIRSGEIRIVCSTSTLSPKFRLRNRSIPLSLEDLVDISISSYWHEIEELEDAQLEWGGVGEAGEGEARGFGFAPF